jgi:hypothetical protein
MWSEFLAETGFEPLVRDLALQTLEAAGQAWPGGAPWAGFAFNCSSAWGFLHISLSRLPARAAMEPPDWEHECAEADLPETAGLWNARYEPVRLRYEQACAANSAYPNAFLHSLRRVMARLEQEGVFEPHPGIRLLVTEVDADTVAEEAELARMRQALMNEDTP